MDKIVTRYKHTAMLNGNTPSTGSITVYDGQIIEEDKKDPWEHQFIEVTDCHNKIRLHRASYDTQEDWLEKVTMLKQTIDDYYEHLRSKHTTNA